MSKSRLLAIMFLGLILITCSTSCDKNATQIVAQPVTSVPELVA